MPTTERTERLVKLGEYILLRVEGTDDYFVQMTKDASIKIKKKVFKLSNCIDKPYYTHYELNKETLTINPIEKNLYQEDLMKKFQTDYDVEEDNRNLSNDGKAQTLTAEEIRALKKEGGTQGDLIEKIIQGSTTFHTKTAFAQEKYIKKLKLKHKQNLCVLEVSLADIVDSNFKKEPKRIGSLRIDSLARMMTFGNIHSKSSVMLFESCMGLVAAAILDRLGPEARLFKGYPEKKSPNSDNHLPKLLNFPKSHFDIVKYFEVKSNLSDDKIFQDFQGVDSLILAGGEFDPVAIFAKLFDFLKPGGCFVVYSIFQEPLMQLYRKLKGNVIMLELHDTWMREYQVLPHRTHPMMRTSSTSGYLLTGLKNTNKFKFE